MWQVLGRTRKMVEHFVDVCRRAQEVNVGKNKVMVLKGEEGLECQIHVDGMILEHESKFKYLGCVLDELGINEAV